MEVWWGGDIFLETGEEVWDEEQLEGGLGRGLRLNCKKKRFNNSSSSNNNNNVLYYTMWRQSICVGPNVDIILAVNTD